jgi:hypothetical protein
VDRFDLASSQNQAASYVDESAEEVTAA